MTKSPNSVSLSNKTHLSSEDKPWIEIQERVRYSETDRMGVAHNKNYLEWFEIGRTEFCRQRGIPYRQIEQKGYYLVVAEAFCRYKKPLRYDEEFIIRTVLEQVVPKKVIFKYVLLTKEERKIVASGYTVHVVTNARAEVCSLPPEILEKIKA
jgi:acyl-CoA thioester hydrolase